jgi:hypothetical protein
MACLCSPTCPDICTPHLLSQHTTPPTRQPAHNPSTQALHNHQTKHQYQVDSPSKEHHKTPRCHLHTIKPSASQQTQLTSGAISTTPNKPTATAHAHHHDTTHKATSEKNTRTQQPPNHRKVRLAVIKFDAQQHIDSGKTRGQCEGEEVHDSDQPSVVVLRVDPFPHDGLDDRAVLEAPELRLPAP